MVDLKLIEDCKANDKKAQIELYRKYNQAMYNIAYRLVQNTEDAEDVIQESFLNAFKKIHQFKAEVTFGAWLKRIVINRSINHFKKNQLATVGMNEAYHAHIEMEHNDSKSNKELVLKDVREAIHTLPEKYKYVVMLYLIEGYDHIEISEILNISVAASKTQLMRGKIKLKKALKLKGYGERS
ncbi:sigma-70 family RNA polymerase sigma factor [Aquimarina sp. 2201CG5-10]|uniref:RNA polymerase sigma factor n=1 Tax=Aquimarina callyspongiae TaxID=3098150 RepID=UPI002AB53929|nr:sigma-70 family RNA polymerase sigma factor [Aquimarina sp. 2201CG5-10]MDY8134671.1 sigma-70 family RNA polymerase sigma factor [Aquimarina sp. 2201CG5-10]